MGRVGDGERPSASTSCCWFSAVRRPRSLTVLCPT